MCSWFAALSRAADIDRELLAPRTGKRSIFAAGARAQQRAARVIL